MKVTRQGNNVTVDLPGVGQLVGHFIGGDRVELRPSTVGIANFYTEGYARTANVDDRLYFLGQAVREAVGKADVFIEFPDGRTTYLPGFLPPQIPPALLRERGAR